MERNEIIIRGAAAHNLKKIDIKIPRDKFTVVTGLSGSGKSSLAFDTIYAEGQRRYIESLSSYARQFLGQMDKPEVEYIEGLSPAIAIDQKTTSKNPRSTVGTVTEIYDYLRLLYARIGTPYCPHCHKPIQPQSVDQIVDRIMQMEEGTKIMVLAPVIRGKKGEYTKLFTQYMKEGYVRVIVDGEMMDLKPMTLEKQKKHTIELVIDRMVIRPGAEKRLSESIETAMHAAEDIVKIQVIDGEEITFSQKFACLECGFSFDELAPRMFSFNSPYGACPKCTGLGFELKVNPALVVPDESKSIRQGALKPWSNNMDTGYLKVLELAAKDHGFDLDTPFEAMSAKQKKVVLYGTGDAIYEITMESGLGKRTWKTKFEGVIPNIERRYRETTSEWMRTEFEAYMTAEECSACHGARLKPEALAVLVNGINIHDLTNYSIREMLFFFENLTLTEREEIIARQIVKEVKARLGFLINVGIGYLTLSRGAGTLSGGEAQRIRLATQIGSGLMGVLYILDEPSIGLHQRDNQKLISALKGLRDMGNTLIVVEHDEETMRAADHIVDIGPGAGIHGGEVVAEGTVEDIINTPGSITGDYLSGRKTIDLPESRRPIVAENFIHLYGGREHNLKNVNVGVPLGVMTCVTGVSGSGKSTLVHELLYKSLAKTVNRALTTPGDFDRIEGVEKIDKIIHIDQSPIGRTPRSNPATYTKTFDLIRDVFAQLPEAKVRGYEKGRFSFNVKGGRCEACKGDGIVKIEMNFLSDVFVPCEVCKGARYNRETLEVRYKGKNIAEVLDMTVDEALVFFENHPNIRVKLQTLSDVGLGYIRLGQPSNTLSGGEAQRIKLATELSRPATGKTLYILDEPTTGLHFEDVRRLIGILQRLTDKGNSVLVIEHNLDVIKVCDYIIDMGPEGGEEGGRVVAAGTPEEVAAVDRSYTGQFLKPLLGV